MFYHRQHQRGRGMCMVVALTLAASLWFAEHASAQVVWIAPDHSVVLIGRQQPIRVGGFFTFGPAVVSADRRFVRISGPFSGTIIVPNRGPIVPAFIKPFTAADRIRASNIQGSFR